LPVLFSASWLASEEGKAPGLVCVAQDISEWKDTKEKLQILTERLISAQEEERKRLARELHDDLTQRLAAVAIDAGRLEGLVPEDGRGRVLLARIKQQMAELSKGVHGLSRRLHPSTLDDLGLGAAIESESRLFFERGGPPVEFICSGSFDTLPKSNQLALYRIVQEALSNVAKHSGADEVKIELLHEGDRVTLSISDNGRGFERKSAGTRAGIGLASMEERVRLMSGELRIESAHGQGTRVLVAVPAQANYEQTVDSAG
jgi:signal transduction histidine kinase